MDVFLTISISIITTIATGTFTYLFNNARNRRDRADIILNNSKELYHELYFAISRNYDKEKYLDYAEYVDNFYKKKLIVMMIIFI